LVNLLKAFGTGLQGEESGELHVISRHGRKVGADCHPGKSFWPQALARVLRDMDINRDEFDRWARQGRKPRAPKPKKPPQQKN